MFSFEMFSLMCILHTVYKTGHLFRRFHSSRTWILERRPSRKNEKKMQNQQNQFPPIKESFFQIFLFDEREHRNMVLKSILTMTRSRKFAVTTMKIKSDRVTFTLVAAGVVCTIIASMGLLYRAFEVSISNDFSETYFR